MILLLGVGSAVIDNVPLVAASLGMFSEPMNDQLWHFIAYSACTFDNGRFDKPEVRSTQ